MTDLMAVIEAKDNACNAATEAAYGAYANAGYEDGEAALKAAHAALDAAYEASKAANNADDDDWEAVPPQPMPTVSAQFRNKNRD